MRKGKSCANEMTYSIQFNVVSKHLGCDRMSFFLNEAAGDVRDMLMPILLQQQEKAKL
jgi:carnitine O-acetyltransferase